MWSDHDPWRTGLAAIDVLSVSHGSPQMPRSARAEAGGA
jgi:hypothetical protein